MSIENVTRSTYDRRPAIQLGAGHDIVTGPTAWKRIRQTAQSRSASPVVVFDTYPGVDLDALKAQVAEVFPGYAVLDVESLAAIPVKDYEALIAGNLTDDRVFGVMCSFRLEDFYDSARLQVVADMAAEGPCVLVGWGAALVPVEPTVTVIADMARWELQLRQRAGATNWRADNAGEDNLRKYKRGFFVEWRVADRHKLELLKSADFIMDTNTSMVEAGLISIETFWHAMDAAVAAPFRVVPFFDPGVWGGQWMKSVCGLDGDAPNYAWCFDCVPEENSLLLRSGDADFELPSLDLVLTRPQALLGALTHARFGPEFPIRFDFLDTMGGGNLSLQVHPLTGYIQEKFGMHYTQDESYYMLDAGPDAHVYLGLREGIDRDAMAKALRVAEHGDESFQAENFVGRYPAHKHDHFSIPAGTVHCSGQDSMVLEISATPYIFTFKLWDWDRVGLDGVPRPVHLDHGLRNIQWERDEQWVRRELLDQVEMLGVGESWVEERTGLHQLEFIETRRHWFTGPVPHDTAGTVNVLNLVEGDEVLVTSPTGAFEPVTIHYAETFIVPAAVGPYVIAPAPGSHSDRFATLKTWVRGTKTD